MIVLAVVIEGGTGVHRRIVMLIALIGILRNPKDIEKLKSIPEPIRFNCKPQSIRVWVWGWYWDWLD